LKKFLSLRKEDKLQDENKEHKNISIQEELGEWKIKDIHDLCRSQSIVSIVKSVLK
jgi:hypothetical protein